MCHIFFIHLSVDGHLGCFHVLAIVNTVRKVVKVDKLLRMICVISDFPFKLAKLYLLQILYVYMNVFNFYLAKVKMLFP